ncbi:antibiotic biosynthesis monooxygenase [Phenylobacterium sp. LjRoot219]|uniref:antibiotic biosynthesis monooxygenase family protein n=1 Tax=Phenylobacterium sp. LjRoot219 TaxID=3342283 RepID=UPI003ED09417
MADTDGVTITFERRLKPEAVETFLNMRDELVAGVSQMPGFRSIRIVQHKDEPNRFLFVEHWDSEDDHRNYIAWRMQRGELGGFQDATLSAELNVWPTLVVKA